MSGATMALWFLGCPDCKQDFTHAEAPVDDPCFVDWVPKAQIVRINKIPTHRERSREPGHDPGVSQMREPIYLPFSPNEVEAHSGLR